MGILNKERPSPPPPGLRESRVVLAGPRRLFDVDLETSYTPLAGRSDVFLTVPSATPRVHHVFFGLSSRSCVHWG